MLIAEGIKSRIRLSARWIYYSPKTITSKTSPELLLLWKSIKSVITCLKACSFRLCIKHSITCPFMYKLNWFGTKASSAITYKINSRTGMEPLAVS